MNRILTALGLFVLVAMGVSVGLVAIAGGAGVLGGPIGRGFVIMLYPLGPLLAALAVQRWLGLPFTSEGFGVTFSPSFWLPAAYVLPVVIAGVTLLIERFVPGVTISFSPAAHMPPLPPHPTEAMKKQLEAAKSVSPWVVILGQLGMALFLSALMRTLLALAAEIGWRGVLLRVLGVFGFWRASLLTGVLIGIWSLPLVLLGEYYPGAPQKGFLLIGVYALLLAPLVGFLRLAGKTVIAAALFHGVLMSMDRFIMLFPLQGSNPLWVGIPGAVGLIVLLVANLILVVPRWREADAELRRLALPVT